MFITYGIILQFIRLQSSSCISHGVWGWTVTLCIVNSRAITLHSLTRSMHNRLFFLNSTVPWIRQQQFIANIVNIMALHAEQSEEIDTAKGFKIKKTKYRVWWVHVYEKITSPITIRKTPFYFGSFPK